MSRVTPPVTKLTQAVRRISSSPNASKSSALLDSRARQSVYLPRKLADLKEECSKRQLKTSGTKAEVCSQPPLILNALWARFRGDAASINSFTAR